MKKALSTFTGFLLFIAVASGNSLQFIPNKAQWEGPFDYKAKIRTGYTAFFEKHTITFLFSDYSNMECIHHQQSIITPGFSESSNAGHKVPDHTTDSIKNHAYRVEFINSTTTTITGKDKQDYYQNYFLGNDKSKWKGHVSIFSGIKYEQLYPGIDLLYKTGKDDNLKYEFLVAPHATPQSIGMRYTGADIRIDKKGNLIIKTSLGEISEQAPYSFQIIENKRIMVPSHFVLKNDVVTFFFPEGYNENYELVIDPVVEYQTYSGVNNSEAWACGSSYDTHGRMYSLASLYTGSWPTTVGAFQTAFSSPTDIAMNVYTPDGSGLVYSTYIGGTGTDQPTSVAVNSLGQAAIVGQSSSNDCPTTLNCLQHLNKGQTDAVAFVLSSDGSTLLSGSYYGSKAGDETIVDVVWSSDSTFYVYGKCGGNTTTPNKLTIDMPANAFKQNNTGRFGSYVLKLNTAQTQLLAGTYVGHSPSGRYDPKVIRLNEYTGEILIGGRATSNANYPVTPNAFQQPTAANDWYGTISKFNADLTTLEASSCLYNRVGGIDVDPDGNIYAAGSSNGAITPSPGVYAENSIWSNTFLVKMAPDLTNALLSTNLPPNLLNDNIAFERSNCGHFYLYYPCTDPNILLTPPYNGPPTPDVIGGAGSNMPNGFYLMELDKDFQNLIFAAWLGNGSPAGGPQTSDWHGGNQDIDPEGRIYANQCTATSYPGTPGAWRSLKQNGFQRDASAIVVDMELVRDSMHADITVLPDTVLCLGNAFQFNGNMTGPIAFYAWDFGDGSVNETTNPAPEHNYQSAGTFQVVLEAINPEACDFLGTVKDSITVSVLAPELVSVYPEDTIACNSEPIKVNIEGGATYEWTPASLVDDPTASSVTVSKDGETNLNVKITDHNNCIHNKTVHIGRYTAIANAGPDQLIILGKRESVILDGSASAGASIYWDTNPTLSSLSSLTPVASPRQTTWYYINAEDHACNARDSAKVTVAAFAAPNAFSPNGDNLNDRFRIGTNADEFILVNISIFNRFGERVYHSIKNEGWDGTYNGSPCDVGTYFYGATVTIEDVTYELKGDITLIR